uniref:Fermentation-respiration switch protein n=1 Tax=Pithovirus LCPAC403 TaxID=2506596 RepID=A0A481ZDB6_9VIRU|nr:MAG: fermentation-respiration switch protein [Pithovirus LCPAC403]
MNIISWVIIPIIIIIVIVILVIFNVQDSIVFTRQGTIVDTSHYNIPIKEVKYPSHDGIQLHGLYIKHENHDKHDNPIILFFHGNASTVSEWIRFTKRYYKWGYSVFMMEYRGYGECEGTPKEDLIYEDAMTTYRYVVNHLKYSKRKIILNGVSLGGAICINLASKVDVAATVVDSSFTSMADMADIFIPYVGSYLCKLSFNSIDLIKRVRSPVLIIHSKDDRMIPFEMGKRLCRNAKRGTLIETSGSHNNSNWSSDVSRSIRNFFDKAIK